MTSEDRLDQSSRLMKPIQVTEKPVSEAETINILLDVVARQRAFIDKVCEELPRQRKQAKNLYWKLLQINPRTTIKAEVK